MPLFHVISTKAAQLPALKNMPIELHTHTLESIFITHEYRCATTLLLLFKHARTRLPSFLRSFVRFVDVSYFFFILFFICFFSLFIIIILVVTVSMRQTHFNGFSTIQIHKTRICVCVSMSVNTKCIVKWRSRRRQKWSREDDDEEKKTVRQMRNWCNLCENLQLLFDELNLQHFENWNHTYKNY